LVFVCPPPIKISGYAPASHEKLFLETALPLRELLKTTLSHTCFVILDKTINQSLNIPCFRKLPTQNRRQAVRC